jgi:defect-in-organelle-trafficking protein DotC
MKFKKHFLSSIISGILIINTPMIAAVEKAANGKNDIERILETNTKLSKKDFMIEYYKGKASSGRVETTNPFMIEEPLSINDIALLNHKMFDNRMSNLDDYDLDQIAKDSINSKYKSLREDSVYNEAVKLGIQNALYKVLYDFKKVTLVSVGNEYRQIFNFEELMIANGKVKPPVILELGGGVEKETILKLRSQDASYFVFAQAEVALRAPSYLDYLSFEPIKPQSPETLLMPINNKERTLWSRGAKEGWILGIRQANSIINEGLFSLARDYLGIQRFHMMNEAGIISMPAFEKMNIGTTTDGTNLNIGEETFKIAILPAFNAETQAWRALPRIDDFLNTGEF